jgi:outer membrane protein W
MKKASSKLFIFSLLALGWLSSGQVQAQTEKTWSIGPELGVNFSKYGKDASSNDMKTGVVAGVHLTYSIVNTFGITAKALLAQKGAQYTSGGTTTKQTLNYLEIPVVGRFFLNKEGSFRPNLFIGPSFGFLMGGTNKTGSGEAVKISNYKDVYNTFDFGLTGGLGLNFEIANETRLLLDARYTYGLSDITKASGNANNLPITVTAGVSFGFQ